MLNEDCDSAKFNIALSTLRKGKTDEAKQLYFLYYKQSKSKEFVKPVADLNYLIEENIFAEESKFILKNIFQKQ